MQSESNLMLVRHCIGDLELGLWKVKQRDSQVPGGYDFQKKKKKAFRLDIHACM